MSELLEKNILKPESKFPLREYHHELTQNAELLEIFANLSFLFPNANIFIHLVITLPLPWTLFMCDNIYFSLHNNNIESLFVSYNHHVSTMNLTNAHKHTGQKEGGTQLKLIIDYRNSGQALFKPMR